MSKPPLPTFASDEEAERFVDEADLSEYDLSRRRPLRLRFTDEPRQDIRVSLSRTVVDRAEQAAKAQSKPLDRFLEQVIERALEPSA